MTIRLQELLNNFINDNSHDKEINKIISDENMPYDKFFIDCLYYILKNHKIDYADIRVYKGECLTFYEVLGTFINKDGCKKLENEDLIIEPDSTMTIKFENNNNNFAETLRKVVVDILEFKISYISSIEFKKLQEIGGKVFDIDNELDLLMSLQKVKDYNYGKDPIIYALNNRLEIYKSFNKFYDIFYLSTIADPKKKYEINPKYDFIVSPVEQLNKCNILLFDFAEAKIQDNKEYSTLYLPCNQFMLISPYFIMFKKEGEEE